MTDLEYEPYDAGAEAFDAKLEKFTPPLSAYLAWLWQQGLITRSDEIAGGVAAGDDRGHDEFVSEFIVTQTLDEQARREYDQEYGDEIMRFSEHLDALGMMLTDSTRLADPGPDPFDHALFVSEFYTEQAIGAAERRAERCCGRRGCGS